MSPVSLFSMPETYTEGEAADVSTILESERVSKRTASDSTVNMLEQDFGHYAQELLYIIFAANKERNSSDSDILMSLSKKLEQAAVKLLEVYRELIAAGGSAGCASAEKIIDLMYPNLLMIG